MEDSNLPPLRGPVRFRIGRLAAVAGVIGLFLLATAGTSGASTSAPATSAPATSQAGTSAPTTSEPQPPATSQPAATTAPSTSGEPVSSPSTTNASGSSGASPLVWILLVVLLVGLVVVAFGLLRTRNRRPPRHERH
jgi:cobalamin biosynthesis Mg chelatase CobN